MKLTDILVFMLLVSGDTTDCAKLIQQSARDVSTTTHLHNDQPRNLAQSHAANGASKIESTD